MTRTKTPVGASWNRVNSWARRGSQWARRGSQCVLGLIFPPQCEFCGSRVDADDAAPQLCTACRTKIFSGNPDACRRCGSMNARKTDDGISCLECKPKKLFFDEALALGEYRDEIREAIVKIKTPGGESLANAVGRRLGEHLGDLYESVDIADRPELATCVPKHWSKRLPGGTNGPGAILYGVGRALELPVVEDLLVCGRRIKKQSMLSPEQRRRNVKGAFRVSKCYRINDAHVLLIDDTLTTGATVNESATMLKRAGARRVSVAVVGRAAKMY